MANRLWILLFIVSVFTACSELPDGRTAASPTTLVTPELEMVQEERTSTAVSPTEQPAATAQPTVTLTAVPPTNTPTPGPLRVLADATVPVLINRFIETSLVGSQSGFEWVETGADVTVKINEGRVIAGWVYAAVVPFPTVVDEISLADLQAAWDGGTLYMDVETAAVITQYWGEPAVPVMPLPEEALVAELWQQQADYETPVLGLLPFDRLVPELKVLAVDGVSPLAAEFEPDSYSLTVPFGLIGDPDAIEALVGSGPDTFSNREENKITQIAMTGPAGMRRAVADRMERYGLTYPAEVTGPVLQAVDIAHMSNENAFAADCPLPDPFDSVNVCNRDEYIELMTWMGIDINEMTGNHLNDWGVEALLHTFDLYDEVGIQTFGGGRNLAHAQEPLLIEHNGNKLAFVGCNPVGPPNGWAGEDYPGSMPCDDYELILSQISELNGAGYLVFATLQYLEDYQYEVLQNQRADFHNLAAAGATAVSGSHGHHPQGFSFFAGSFIHYGLGNLLADQMFSLGTRQTFIDIYTVYDGRLISVELWTGLIEDFARQRLMTAEERQDLLETVFGVSDWSCCEKE